MKKSYTKQLAALAFIGLYSATSAYAADVDGAENVNLGAAALNVPGAPLTVTGDAQVTETLTVRPLLTIASTSTDTATGAGVDPSLGSVGATTTAVVTKLGETDKSESATTGGGATIENNGDATFAASTGTASDANFSRFTTVDVYNAGEPLAGQPVPASQMYYAADAAGTPISPSFATEAALDAWVTATPLTDPAFAALVTTVPTATAGGNVDVGGVLSLAGDSAQVPAYAPVPNVAAAIGGNTDAIGDNTAAIGGNTGNISTNTGNIAGLQTELDVTQTGAGLQTGGTYLADVAANYTSTATSLFNADQNLDTALKQEVDARTALIRDAGPNADGNQVVHIGDNSLITQELGGTQRISAQDGLGNDLAIRFDGASGVIVDNTLNVGGDVFVGGNPIGLQSQINSNASGIARNRNSIDQNTRGIAMVAALQHTTVLPGMTNALDVSAAHFEGETGMSINYARRINENWQVNFGAASTTDFDESVIKAGVGVQW